MLPVLKQFRVLLRSIDNHYRQVHRKSGLGGAQVWALSEIVAGPSLTVSELANKLAIHRSTASNLVGRLEELGLVERIRAETDRRVVCLRPTSAGKRALRRAPGPSAGVLQNALMNMPAGDLDSLHRLLDALLKRMGHVDHRSSTTMLGEMFGRQPPRR